MSTAEPHRFFPALRSGNTQIVGRVVRTGCGQLRRVRRRPGRAGATALSPNMHWDTLGTTIGDAVHRRPSCNEIH
jgi:hypothetical protein